MPPLKEYDFSADSAPSFFMRLMALNWSSMEGLSAIGTGFLAPKKADGDDARDTERLRENDRGLLAAVAVVPGVGPPPLELELVPAGVNVFAAGLGLNSIARTLNFEGPVDADAWGLTGLVIRGCSLAGPVGGVRGS
jgi:hypothetical protein